MKGNPAAGSKPSNILQQRITSFPVACRVSFNQEVHRTAYKQPLSSLMLPGVDQIRQSYIVMLKSVFHTSVLKQGTG